jgi:hypothetical protein
MVVVPWYLRQTLATVKLDDWTLFHVNLAHKEGGAVKDTRRAEGREKKILNFDMG